MESQILGKRRKGGECLQRVLILFFFSFLLFLLWSGSGTSRKVVSALKSSVDVTSRLITVSMCFLGSLLSSLTWFTEILPTGSKFVTPKSFSFQRDHFPLATLIFIIFLLFLIFNRMGAWCWCIATHLYILYVAADESTSGWEFYCYFLNPHNIL